VSSIRADLRLGHQYFVVAKHDFYLEDAIKSFAAFGIEIQASNSLEEIRSDILKNSEHCTVFVPHYSKLLT